MKTPQEIRARIKEIDEHLNDETKNHDFMVMMGLGESKATLEWVLDKSSAFVRS